MKYQDVLALYNILDTYTNQKVPTRFAFFIARNKQALQPEMLALQEAQKPLPEYEEYDQKRLDLIRKYALYDDKGQVVIENGQAIIAQTEKFDYAIIELQKQYTEALAAEQQRQLEFIELLNEDCQLPALHTIDMQYLPAEMTSGHLEVFVELDLITGG